MTKLLNAAAALAVVVGFYSETAEAANLNRFSSAWFFGDSLSDPGNLYAATGGATPASPPYYKGRFSNGPVWAEAVAAPFKAKGLATGNFAFGGATAVANGDEVPDLAVQAYDLFAGIPDAALGDRPVAALWFGANDLFAAIDGGGNVRATARSAARAVAGGALGLHVARGIDDVVLINLPDLGMIPAYRGTAAMGAASAGTRVFNRTLARLGAGLNKGGLNAEIVDVNAAFAAAITDPARLGLVSATVPCLIPGVSVCSPEEAEKLFFFDPVHPNNVVHAEIGAIASGSIAPVPLPAPLGLLAAGLAGLALVARRRRA